MPLGAARLNTLARYVAAGGSASEWVYSMTSTEFNNRLYTSNKLSYCGDDSSGQPVFYYAYYNGTNAFEGSLLKINNDETVSEAVITYKNTDEIFDGQGVFGKDSSGNNCVVSNVVYRVSGVIKCITFKNSIDLDNLTFGTTYSNDNWTNVQPNAGITTVDWTGNNGLFIAGYRNGGARFAVSWTTATSHGMGSGEYQISAIGDGVWQNIRCRPYVPFSYKNDVLLSNGNANQSTFFQIGNGGQSGATRTVDNISVGLAQTEMFFMDSNHDLSLTIAAKDTSAQAVLHDITWGASLTDAISTTAGSTLTFSDNANWNEGFACAVDETNATAYILYNASSEWRLTSLTHTGTTLSEGTPTAVGVTTTNWRPGQSNAACIANSAQGDLYVAIIDDSTTGNPQLYVKDLGA